jgi:hypothetical protein
MKNDERNLGKKEYRKFVYLKFYKKVIKEMAKKKYR